jgi:hypothetical protein
MNIIDPSTYENDPELTKRVNFIYKVLEARLDNNLSDRDIILNYVNGGLTFKVDFLDYDNLDLAKEDVAYLHQFVTESLQYQFIYQNIDNFKDIYTRFETSEFSERGNIVHEFRSMVDYYKNQFRMAEVDTNIIDMEFSLQPGQFESAVTNTYNLITNPSRRLICGMQGLNEMLGGGFEAGRVYMLLGTSGVGKSVTLLNLIYQMKMFNRNYKTKDPTKTPCIVLLTMENTVVETITRLFDLVIEGSKGMENYSLTDVLNLLRTQGQLEISDTSPIDIIIKYKANKSADTGYLYTICDDLEDKGYEVICMVQDHVKRIRSIYPNSDLRIELGDIVNEMKVFAAYKDIPLITNSHLNRDAARILEEAARKSNQDAAKLLGKSNIGESMLMIDNLDCGIIINLDYDQEGSKYMGFSLIKMRGKTYREYIAQPFSKESSIRLIADLGGIPQFKESLHIAPELKRNTCIKTTGAASIMSSDQLDSVIDILEDDIKSNAFNSQNNMYLNQPDPVKNANANFAKELDTMLADIQNQTQPFIPVWNIMGPRGGVSPVSFN